MKKEKKEKDFRKKPVYPGGLTAMRSFIKNHLEYPPTALKAKIEGSVILSITIDYKGEVVHAKLISGIGYGCDEEAKRVVQLLKFEVPKNRGYKSKSSQKVGVHFKLPKKVESNSTAISYQYTNTSKEKEEGDSKNASSSSYFYTLEW